MQQEQNANESPPQVTYEELQALVTEIGVQLADAHAKYDRLADRLKSHSLYVVNNILPQIESLRDDVKKVAVSDQKFLDLENAVADLAGYVMGTNGKWPTDRRETRLKRRLRK